MKACVAYLAGCALLAAVLAAQPLAWLMLALMAWTGAVALALRRPLGVRMLPLVIAVAVATILVWAPTLARLA